MTLKKVKGHNYIKFKWTTEPNKKAESGRMSEGKLPNYKLYKRHLQIQRQNTGWSKMMEK